MLGVAPIVNQCRYSSINVNYNYIEGVGCFAVLLGFFQKPLVEDPAKAEENRSSKQQAMGQWFWSFIRI